LLSERMKTVPIGGGFFAIRAVCGAF
jgi:hypothetical protein